MKPGTAVVISSLVLIAACSRPLQRPERTLAVAPPKVWQGGETAAASEGTDWWAYFGDRGLDNAVTRALTFNQDLRAAAARVSAAEAEARIAGAALRPSVDLSLNRGRQRQNFVGLPIPGREGSVLSATYGSAGVSLGIAWEPDVWGRISAGKLATIASTQIEQADLIAARLSLTGQVAKGWFGAIEAQRQVGLARTSLLSYETSTERVRARFQRGLRPSLDLRLALTEIQRGEALLQQRQEQLRRAIRQLEILLGDYPKGEHALAEDLPLVPEAVPAGLPSQLLHRRPDLVSAERALLAADARIQQSKADLRPRFSLTTAGGTASSSLTDLLNPDFLAWSLISGLTQPIYDRNRLKTVVERDQARAREAGARYQSAMLRAYGEVESALASESALAGREKALEAATKLSLGARDEAERRYRAGLADIITVLSTQRTALDSESQLLTVRRQRLDNRVDLHLALGGGFATDELPRDEPQTTQAPIREVSGL
jgi:multidrug efflux system outer membrane protein